MDKNRYTVAVALLLLFLFVWSAGTMHWRYAIALMIAGTILFLSNLTYYFLAKKLPDAETTAATRNALWKRDVGAEFPKLRGRRMLGIYASEDKSAEARWLIDHMNATSDRQIMKACGLIAFNALVMAVMAVEMSRLPAPIQWDDSLSDILRFGMLGIIGGLAVSSLICLTMFWVYWERPDSYGTYASNFSADIEMIAQRTRELSLGVFVSGISLIMAFAVIVMTELLLGPMPGA